MSPDPISITSTSDEFSTSIEVTPQSPPKASGAASVCSFLRYVNSFRKTLIIVLAPLILALLFCVVSPRRKDMRCLYVVLIMITYWISEVLPLAVTALLPLVLYPMLGVMPSTSVAKNYFKDSIFLFAGGYFIAIALEKSLLHKRAALGALLIVGSNPRNILFAIMCCTSFLSLWISNGAATGMMLPIVQALLVELIAGIRRKNLDKQSDANQEDVAKEIRLTRDTLTTEELDLCKMMYLASCYASSIGGIGTLTGTPPNVIVYGFVQNRYGSDTTLTYVTWMLYGIPQVVFDVLFCWIVLVTYFLGFRSLYQKQEASGEVALVIKKQYQELGKMSYQEWNVVALFILLVIVWITRDPRVIPGWNDLFPKGYVSNTVPAIIAAIFLFILPDAPVDWTFSAKNRVVRAGILNWKYLQSKFPWDMLLLIGGGFAMAAGIEQSGLSGIIGKSLSELKSLPLFLLSIVSAVLGTSITEFTSNAAAATILTPLYMAAAEQLRINPLYLVMTGGITVSYAFMLPIGTAANAMVFSLGILRVSDMVKVGFFVILSATFVTVMAANTIGLWLFGPCDRFPAWAVFNATRVPVVGSKGAGSILRTTMKI